RRSRSLVETGAADFVLRLLYYGLRQLLQTLTRPHSVNLHLRCALDVVEPVICVGYRLAYRGNESSYAIISIMPTSVWPISLMWGSSRRVSALANGICVWNTALACGSAL